MLSGPGRQSKTNAGPAREPVGPFPETIGYRAVVNQYSDDLHGRIEKSGVFQRNRLSGTQLKSLRGGLLACWVTNRTENHPLPFWSRE